MGKNASRWDHDGGRGGLIKGKTSREKSSNERRITIGSEKWKL